MKIITGDLILTEDTSFNESIKVDGNIKGYFNLKVAGDIDAWDIDARDIDAWDIVARDINARDIDAWNIVAGNIVAGNINARDIICEKRIKIRKKFKTVCRVYVKDKSKLKRKEQEE